MIQKFNSSQIDSEKKYRKRGGKRKRREIQEIQGEERMLIGRDKGSNKATELVTLLLFFLSSASIYSQSFFYVLIDYS